MRWNEAFLIYCCLFCISLFGQDRVVVIGSGPAGLTAAIYTARAGIETIVIEGGEPGGQISLSHSVENFPGFPEGISGFELGENMREQAKRFGTKLLNGNIVEVDFNHHPFVITLNGGKTLEASAIIIASGASAKWLGLESEQKLIGKGVSSCAVCDGFFFKGKEVVVVGGGDTAIEDALFLTNYASKVTVVHRRDTLKASKYLQTKAFSNPNIHFIWNATVADIMDEEGDVSGVILNHKRGITFYPCEGVFIAIGHQPNTRLFQGKLDLTDAGYIVTKPFSTATSVEGVFAAGDVADSRYRQAVTAAGTGCMAAMDVYYFFQQLNQEECKKAYEPIQNDLYMQYRSKIDSLNQIWHGETSEILKELTESLTTEAKNTEKEVVKPKERKMLRVTSKNLQKLLDSTKPFIIDCYADWCAPCRMLSVIYKELNQEYGDLYRFTKLNVEEEEEIAKSFHVRSLPTLLFIKNGKEVGRHTGYVDKEKLLAIIIDSFKEPSEEEEQPTSPIQAW